MSGRASAEAAAAASVSALPPDAAWRALARRRVAWLVAAGAVFALLALADIATGPSMLGLSETARAILRPGDAPAMTRVIVHDIRLPVSCMAALVGMALGMAGVHMQTILGNPLASPYTLGFSAAAGFGAALAILTGAALPGAPGLTVPLAAFAMCLGAGGIVWAFARMRGMSPEIMVLAGIATLFLFQAAQSLVQYAASPEVLQAIVFWLFGSLMRASWDNVPIVAAVVLLGAGLVLPDLWRLTALRLGEPRAAAIGVDVPRLRLKVFAVVALLTSGAVAFVGTIGFVGLVAPHVARMCVGEDQRLLLPMSALSGGIIMLGASTLSKLVSPGAVIPIGIVTAAIGVPFLFALILRGRRRHW